MREGAAPSPCIKGDRDSDRPWGQISQNQSKNDKKGKIVQRSQLCDHLVGRRDTMNAESNETLPVSEKYMLTIKEAAAYFNIGIKKLRRIAEDNLGTVAVSSLSARSSKNLFLILQKYSSFYLPKVVAITGHKSEHRMTPKTLENSHFWQKGSTFMARPSLAEKDILNPSEAIEYFVLSRRKFYDLLNNTDGEDFLAYYGERKLILRVAFERYLRNHPELRRRV